MVRFLALSFLVAAMLLSFGRASSSAITYQEGVRAAKDQNKPLYLYFYSDT